ncbi:hypothetical protein [Microbacterium testaceum]|uniref:hypothetical protein n=1 Tax=Microbacterium testaceum TaxID=2033 RepID=UPI002AC38EF9|nr:hypothetical protein [Microbacterium testaceum]MDZ5146115.1 hypothetical protein [Microbacterium testaceum]
MTMVSVEIDREVIAQAAQMVGYWNSGEVLNRINMGEGFTLAALFDALHEHGIADHIIREVWEGECDGDRDPLPWANRHGSRLTMPNSTPRVPQTGAEPALGTDQ